jgi:hypothetical protein
MAIPQPQVQHRLALDSGAVTQPTHPSTPRPSAPPAVGGVHWPEAPQDVVPQDAPYAAVLPASATAAAPARWSGRRTAAIAGLALALTSAGALAAAAATPSGITGPTEQRGGAGVGGPGNRQLGPGGGTQPGQGVPPGPGAQGQPGAQGRGTR